MNKTKHIFKILVINPGSTSTKVALFDNAIEQISENIHHQPADLKPFKTIIEQDRFRLSYIRNFLTTNRVTHFAAIAARGGMLHPLQGGVYSVNALMLEELKQQKYGEHASNLGAILAARLADEYDCPAYIADPPIVDELEPLARFSGLPDIQRKSQFHALNQKYVAQIIAGQLHKNYADCNFIVAHLGGGISVGAHCQGHVIDVNNALDGDGPFSPERSGGLPVGDLLRFIEKNPDSLSLIKKKIVGGGGVMAYCGTNDIEELKQRIENGDEHARLVFEAMLYQVCKEIAMHGATLKGQVTAVILTGGMVRAPDVVAKIKERIAFLAPVHVVPGEKEMESLAFYAWEVLEKKRPLLNYTAKQASKGELTR
jgi:butyrate kinase